MVLVPGTKNDFRPRRFARFSFTSSKFLLSHFKSHLSQLTTNYK
nr:MAG TPA: hypothetical protein [Caudoviricetes sp.]